MVDRQPLGTPPEVAAYLQIPEKTLAQWRYLGAGPKYRSVGRHVRYVWSEVDAWLTAQAAKT